MRIRLPVSVFLALLMIACMRIPAFAAEPVPFPAIAEELNSDVQGVFITEVPQWECGIFCGNRRILEGDALTSEQVAALTIEPYAENEAAAAISWIPIGANGCGAAQTFHLTLRGNKNLPPEANDSKVETYKNLAIDGALSCSDPDGDALRYSIVVAPKRGDVEIGEDGSFLYTPRKNKVGTDRFIFIATDAAGNQSAEATVTVQIQNPRIKGAFADMDGDPNEYEARYLRENEIFSGEMIGGTLCFNPEKAVTGDEFLVMLMRACGMEPEYKSESDWITPWKEAALRAGLRTAVSSERITEYDAASLVSSLLHLREEVSISVFADSDITEGSISLAALIDAGIPAFSSGDIGELTRREAAVLLCGAAEYLSEQAALFPWE